jgi:hypothetical protein
MTTQKKDKTSFTELVSQLSAIAIWDRASQARLRPPSFSAADIDLGDIAFTGHESLALLATTVDELHSSMTDRAAYSQEFLKTRLLRWLRERRKHGESFATKADVDLVERLRELPLVQHRVFRAVYGASLDDSPSPVALGPCTFYSTRTHRSFLNQNGLLEDDTYKWLGDVSVIAEVTTQAVDRKAACHLADTDFSAVESLITLTDPHDPAYRRVAIISEHAAYWRPSFICAGPTMHLSAENLGPVDFIPLDSPAFSSPGPAMARLWRLLGARHRNKWENKLIRGAKWLGNAFSCCESDSTVVRATTALESLLYVDTHQPYMPSRTAVLSEAAAHIVGTSIEHCLEVESQVKQLYDARSRTVHNGDPGLNTTQLHACLKMAREVLFRLLADDEWQSIDSPEAFRRALSRMRYAYHLYRRRKQEVTRKRGPSVKNTAPTTTNASRQKRQVSSTSSINQKHERRRAMPKKAKKAARKAAKKKSGFSKTRPKGGTNDTGPKGIQRR